MEIVLLTAMFVITLIVGILIGIATNIRKTNTKVMGWLRIDHSEYDAPARMFVELKGVTPDMIAANKYVLFEVINESYISHN